MSAALTAQRPTPLDPAESCQQGAGRIQIAVPSLRGIEFVPVQDVRCFLAEQKYVTIHHRQGKTIANETLCRLEAEFGSLFLRVHRSALVAVRFIEALERPAPRCYVLRVAGIDERIPVSRRRAGAVRRAVERCTWAPTLA